MRILVTGGAGFVGRNLVPLLKHNIKKTLMSLPHLKRCGLLSFLDAQKAHPHTKVCGFRKLSDIKVFSRTHGEIKGDLKNYKDVKRATKNIDAIIHLANSENYRENTEFIRNIIRTGKENKVKKIIFISSMAAKRSFPDEYGKSKLEAEKMLKESGLNYTILRPSLIYGKGSMGFKRIENLMKKIPFFTPIIGTGKYKIMPVHIKDVVKSIENCIKNKKTDRKEYDVVGDSIYFIDLINFIKKEKNIKRINVHIPVRILNIFSCLAPKIISKKRIRNLTQDTKADINNRKELGYGPIKFEDFKNEE